MLWLTGAAFNCTVVGLGGVGVNLSYFEKGRPVDIPSSSAGFLGAGLWNVWEMAREMSSMSAGVTGLKSSLDFQLHATATHHLCIGDLSATRLPLPNSTPSPNSSGGK